MKCRTHVILIQVKDQDANHHPVPLNLRQTIGELTKILAKKLQFSVEEQSLRLGGKVLQDARSLASYQINVNSIIECYQELPKGCNSEESEETNTIG